VPNSAIDCSLRSTLLGNAMLLLNVRKFTGRHSPILHEVEGQRLDGNIYWSRLCPSGFTTHKALRRPGPKTQNRQCKVFEFFMKKLSLLKAVVLAGSQLLLSSHLSATGLTIPTSDAGIADSISNDLPVPLTAAELAVPPLGQIQKRHLRSVNNLRTLLAADLAAVPAGAEGQGSPWFAKCQAYKSGLDAVAASSLQSDCFALIPKISAVLAARTSDAPAFTQQCAGLANGFSPVLVYAIERHVIDQNGTVSAPNVISFSTVFSTGGFLSEGDWEATPIPVDSPGIMILDAAVVVTHLKTRPWEEADQFLGKATAAEAFARYAPSGDGMAILKTKYAANQAIITAKWNELTTWVATRRPPT
jgi:hypothetical protein